MCLYLITRKKLDFHLDPYYMEGASVSSFCHRKDGENGKGIAGKFGALGSDCDSPKALVSDKC